ncbi:MAG: efflux RND transporter permease subunit [Planctomycetota bacterium]|jgi:HAE1 family hydrophobic/amphiphilic exporter-1
MDIVGYSIKKPVTVTVGVILIVMFGLIGFDAIPIQLVPNVDRPVINVSTFWPGASPQEMVSEITKEQEERLKNIENLRKMSSMSAQGSSTITLELYVGSDIDRAMQEVSDALRQVPSYPEEVNEPVISATANNADGAITWLILDLDPAQAHKHPGFDITTIQDDVNKELKPFLERVSGVAQVNVFGGRPREVRIEVDPARLARRGITYSELAAALRNENANTSAGTIAEGKRDYRVRVLGQYASEEDILETIVAYRQGSPVYVRDVATVEIGFTRHRGFVRSSGSRALAINAMRQTGANVMQVMEDVRDRVDEIRADILPGLHPDVGADLRLRMVYDETDYIQSSTGLVLQNLWIGGTLAGVVLMLFLRSFVSTGVILIAIPVSIVGTFLVLLALGRNLNVVSLAGLAFAVGMVVDNAIVVLENIDRRLRMGEPPRTAALNGGREVWGAILASTLTTVAVFIPALTIQEEAGQLFRDISIAIVAAVVLSLLTSITVIPTACSRWLRIYSPTEQDSHPVRTTLRSLFGLTPLFAHLNRQIGRAMLWCMSGWRGWTVRPLIILGMTFASIFFATRLAPPMDYLPAGNQNLVFGGLLIPPGYSYEQKLYIAERLEAYIEPYAKVDPNDADAVAALPPIHDYSGKQLDPVPLNTYFVGAFGDSIFVGASSAWPEVVLPISYMITSAMNTIPDAFGGAGQASIFGSFSGGRNSISVEFLGPSMDKVRAAVDVSYDEAMDHDLFKYGGAQGNPPNFNLTQPEFQAKVTRTGHELGVRPAVVGQAVRALFDGAFVGEFREADGDTIDIVLLPIGGSFENFQQIASTPIATPAGPVVPLDTLVEILPATTPQSILRVEEFPSIAINFTPPSGVPLGETMQIIENEIIQPARDAGLIDSSMRARMEGTAAKLTEVRESLFGAPWDSTQPRNLVQRASTIISLGLLLLGAITCIVGLTKATRRHTATYIYGALGAIILFGVVGGLFAGLATNPNLLTARFIWALAVTYLLMCALFESFVYPFVIMFSVPLAVVGGFAGLKIVHDISQADPTVAPQQLDVLTMLGFVILIGVVVNNAILLVHQALHFMRGQFGQETLPPLEAISESVRTRIRPIFMSTLTSVGGMAPLVLFPGAGSEMYRGLGSVVIGGLLVSTIFTLVLVPLLLSMTVQMRQGLAAIVSGTPDSAPPSYHRPSRPDRPAPSRTPSSGELVTVVTSTTAP